MLRKRLFVHTSNPWEGDNVTLKADLIEVANNWSHIVGTALSETAKSCPISYSQNEVAECSQIYKKMQEVEEQFGAAKECLGVGSEGWVPNERFHISKAMAANMKDDALRFAESNFERDMLQRHWPFDDQDEDE